MSPRCGSCTMALVLALSVANGCVSGDDVVRDTHAPTDESWDLLDGTGGGHRVQKGVPTEVASKLTALSRRPIVAPIDRTARLLERVAAMPPESTVSLTIDFADVDVQASVSKGGEANRLAVLEARRTAIAARQAPVRAWLEANGAQEVYASWIVNQVRATVAAEHVADVVLQPNVTDASLNVPIGEADPAEPPGGVPLAAQESYDGWGEPLDPGSNGKLDASLVGSKRLRRVAYDGLRSRRSTLLQAMLEEQLDGRTGSRLDGKEPVRIGIFEAAMLNYRHVGWKDCADPSCWSRLIRRKDCSQFPCVDATAPPDPQDPHGTIVSYVAAGSIEGGQDPDRPGSCTTEQIARSGHLPEAKVYFYTGLGSDSIANAIQQSIVDGIDVLNLSLGWGNRCDGTFDASGINQVLKMARSFGVLVTACAGNSGVDGCTSWYPAVRTDTLAVNGLDTYDTEVAYGSLGMLPDASRGDVPIRLFSGWTGESPAVDLSAPGSLRLFGVHQGTSEYETSSASGCSVATPVVSAAAGALKSAFHAMALPTNSAELLMVNMLLMGDAWDANTGKHRRAGLSSLSGAGRIRMHRYDELVKPAGWGAHSFWIHNGETHAFPVGDEGPESPSIQQWKWAGLWFEEDLQKVADVDFFVYDTCPPSGGEVLIAKDISFGLRTRFMLLAPDISGRCLEMRVVGTAVPPEGRRIWIADYFHSGDPELH